MFRRVIYYCLSVVMFFALVFLITLVSCGGETIVDPPANNELNLTKAESELLASASEFGFALLKTINEDEKNSNIFISPYSVSTAFGMALNGAVGDTYTEMLEALEISGLSLDEINSSNRQLMEILTEVDPKVAFQVANSIWYRNDFAVLESFLDVNNEYYSAEINIADFDNPATVDAINNWVEINTSGKIEKIIDDAFIDPAVVMYLINALYFKGTWKYQFKEEDTTPLAFHLVDGTQVEVPTMIQKSKFNYYEDEKLQLVDLPYGDSCFTMTVILPKQTSSVDEIISGLDAAGWDAMMQNVTYEELTLHLPKLKYEYNISLTDIVEKMGMRLAVTPAADFTKITPLGGIYIGDVIHKTFVEINEEGTEAAAVTAITFERTSAGDEKYMLVNKPYIFVIREVSTNSILFAGKILDPTKESNE